jgi:ubiquinone biosynthesis UbiH/UbiF/VisC/COQ6 family hydroxylase
MRERFDIVIIGAGVAGLTTAALLAQGEQARRLRLTVVDAGERPIHDPGGDVALRVSAIATGSADVLDAAGAWDYVRETRACAYERMRVWDESQPVTGGATLRFDAAEFAIAQLGFIVENALLQHALLGVLDDLDVELLFASPVAGLREDGQRYRPQLADGRELRAELVIAADGARSPVREAAGIEAREWRYGQSAFVSHLMPELPHRNTAWQRFLADGPLGMLPLSDGRISVVWSTREERAEEAMQLPDEDLARLLGEASDWVLGELTPAGPRGSFPLCARHAENYVLPGLALIGDAAHAVHPLAGQGANLGLRDAVALAGVVTAAVGGGGHPGDRPVLRRYER